MFGKNQIVGKREFRDLPKNVLHVTSIFYTLQGEGPFMGRPAVFIRLAKCNLACSFCDTYFDAGDFLTFDEIATKIDETIVAFFAEQKLELPEWAIALETVPDTDRHDHPGIVLVITGGEPTLQNNLVEFLEIESDYWADIQVETNGTQDIYNLAQNAVMVVSPKCAEKDGAPTHYLKPSDSNLQQATALKFVVSADPTSAYHDIPDWAKEWARQHVPSMVYVSPMNVYNAQPQAMKIRVASGTPTLDERSSIIEKVSFWEPGLLDLEANRANHEHAARLCMQNGFNLNLQMHLYASLA